MIKRKTIVRWWIRFLCWLSFERHSVDVDTPLEYFWVRVATCAHCNQPVLINQVFCLHEEAIREVLMSHLVQCVYQKRGMRV